ncbi:MAG TPA: OsmC family protein [Casimicrobiaceae bacterium]|nr:OsmC family protein [Casimicrobiaceae bacterium]
MTERTSRQLNDVNLEAIGALIEKIRQEPQAAKTQWKADVRWTGALRSEARSRDLRPSPSDEPSGLGGSNTAPNPVEQLLAALGNCLAVGYAANATVAGIQIRSLRIELEGAIDLRAFLGLGGENAGYESIRATVDLDSDASPEQLKQLHEKVVGSSPVGHTLSRGVPLRIELR